jgi:hypothetical protein
MALTGAGGGQREKAQCGDDWLANRTSKLLQNNWLSDESTAGIDVSHFV